MCLYRLTRRPEKVPTYGYKVFSQIHGELYPDCRTICARPYPTDQWISDVKSYDLITESDVHATYPTGYHVFFTKADAKKWACDYDVIHKVRVDDIVAYGIQRFRFDLKMSAVSARVFVCRRMKIVPNNVKKKAKRCA
jgi:hypothetical protein